MMGSCLSHALQGRCVGIHDGCQRVHSYRSDLTSRYAKDWFSVLPLFMRMAIGCMLTDLRIHSGCSRGGKLLRVR